MHKVLTKTVFKKKVHIGTHGHCMYLCLIGKDFGGKCDLLALLNVPTEYIKLSNVRQLLRTNRFLVLMCGYWINGPSWWL